MRLAFCVVLAMLLVRLQPALGQTPSPGVVFRTEGVWRCQMNGLPEAVLVVTEEPGTLTGAILFYLQQRATEKDAWRATPGVPEPIFHPRLEDWSLLFEVSHRRAHPPRTLDDPPKHFKLMFHSADKAELVNVDEPGTVCEMVRSDY